MMPGISGIKLLHQVRKEISPTLAAIVVTGSGNMDLAFETLCAGAHDVMRKPFTAQDLQKAVEHALA